MSPFFSATDVGDLPIVATAIHQGHDVRPRVARLLALSDGDRLREEDPFTGEWARLSPTRVIGFHSRFEVDLNRPRERAVYRRPEDAWGLEVWHEELDDEVVEESLALYDHFYSELHGLLSEMQRRFGRFVVYDLHTYNHRRGGPEAPPDDPELNPEVNVGTGSLSRDRWTAVVDGFMRDLRTSSALGPLDVRENVRFRGGQLAGWTHQNFPDSACVLAVEVKKFFMDEWTGEGDPAKIEGIGQALADTVPGVLRALESR